MTEFTERQLKKIRIILNDKLSRYIPEQDCDIFNLYEKDHQLTFIQYYAADKPEFEVKATNGQELTPDILNLILSDIVEKNRVPRTEQTNDGKIITLTSSMDKSAAPKDIDAAWESKIDIPLQARKDGGNLALKLEHKGAAFETFGPISEMSTDEFLSKFVFAETYYFKCLAHFNKLSLDKKFNIKKNIDSAYSKTIVAQPKKPIAPTKAKSAKQAKSAKPKQPKVSGSDFLPAENITVGDIAVARLFDQLKNTTQQQWDEIKAGMIAAGVYRTELYEPAKFDTSKIQTTRSTTQTFGGA